MDINFFVEKRNSEGKWEYVVKSLYRGRNYNLFTTLAGVLNGLNVIPISFPRGVPNESCDEITYNISNGHNHSYFYLNELLDFDWNGSLKEIHKCNVNDYIEYKKTGTFNYFKTPLYFKKKFILISNEEMDQIISSDFLIIKNIIEHENIEYITGVKVDNKMYSSYKHFVGEDSDFFDMLNSLKTLGNPKDIRIVFFFEN